MMTSEILKQYRLRGSRPCVYFLIFRGKVVYVGSSICVEMRVYTHRVRYAKNFDSYEVEECSYDEMLSLERKYINLLKPVLNIVDNNGRKHEYERKPRLVGDILYARIPGFGLSNMIVRPNGDCVVRGLVRGNLKNGVFTYYSKCYFEPELQPDSEGL